MMMMSSRETRRLIQSPELPDDTPMVSKGDSMPPIVQHHHRFIHVVFPLEKTVQLTLYLDQISGLRKIGIKAYPKKLILSKCYYG